jgi:hypothetical protein
MWALLDANNIVIDALIGVTYDEACLRAVDGLHLVEMTLENSPGYVGGYYDGKKFNKPLTYPESV